MVLRRLQRMGHLEGQVTSQLMITQNSITGMLRYHFEFLEKTVM